jgi:hypothetical protein
MENNQMSAEKLKAQAFDKIRDIALMDGKQLTQAGYPNVGSAVRQIIIQTHKEIENGNSQEG